MKMIRIIKMWIYKRRKRGGGRGMMIYAREDLSYLG